MFLYECPSLVYLFYLLSLPVIIFAITTKVCKYTNGSYIQTLTCYTGPCLLLSIDTLILSTYQILQVLFSSCLILFDYNDVHNLFFCSLCSPRKRSNMFFLSSPSYFKTNLWIRNHQCHLSSFQGCGMYMSIPVLHRI